MADFSNLFKLAFDVIASLVRDFKILSFYFVSSPAMSARFAFTPPTSEWIADGAWPMPLSSRRVAVTTF